MTCDLWPNDNDVFCHDQSHPELSTVHRSSIWILFDYWPYLLDPMIINDQLLYTLTIHFPSTSFSTHYICSTSKTHIFIKSRIAALTDVRARQKALPLRWFPGKMMVQSKKWMCSVWKKDICSKEHVRYSIDSENVYWKWRFNYTIIQEWDLPEENGCVYQQYKGLVWCGTQKLSFRGR